MNVAFHFDLRLAASTFHTATPGFPLAEKVVRSFCKYHEWQGPVDLFLESLLLHFRAYGNSHFGNSTQVSLTWNPELFDQLRLNWLSSLHTHWFHLGASAELDPLTLRHLFVVLLTNVDATISERVTADLKELSYYHSAFEVDIKNALHVSLYLKSLLPVFSFKNANEAALLVEAGGSSEHDFDLSELLRRAGFRSTYLEEYLPFDFGIRRRI